MGILEKAASYIGKVNYVFGASDPDNGISDCSGFTQKVYKEFGYTIGRTTQEQWQKGEEVSKAELKPGDLVFFKDTYDSHYLDGVSHVGINYGGGMMIDCGSSTGVSKRSFETDYFKQHWLGAKRITDKSEDIGISGNETPVSSDTKTNSFGLKWWGDVLIVVMIIGLIIGSVFFLVKSLENGGMVS